MILSLISWLGLLVFIGLCFIFKDGYGDPGIVVIMGTIVFGIFAIGILVGVSIGPTCVQAEILEFQALQKTLEIARMNPKTTEYELAMFQQKVAEENQWLAR